MPIYQSPGVYVEEISSGSAPIASLGTSTAGFIGVVPDEINIPITEEFTQVVTNETISEIPAATEVDQGSEWTVPLKNYPVYVDNSTWSLKANDENLQKTGAAESKVLFVNNNLDRVAEVTFFGPNMPQSIIGDSGGEYIHITITAEYEIRFPIFKPVTAKKVKLCTNFNEFKKYFGDFSTDADHNRLAHAVYGFFNNGGSRCYVSRVTVQETVEESGRTRNPDLAGIRDILAEFEAIDEIAIVAAPGITDTSTRSAIVTHCQNMGDRFAILDCKPDVNSSAVTGDKPPDCDYAAYYFPWIKVSDPASMIMNPNGKGEDNYLSIPPSGHIAGVYARVDAQRGVHKAPANEVIYGALGLEHKISKNQQDGLNPQGINCIRDLNGNIRIWGARTVGGDANGEFKYINVRRLFLSIKDSIEEGTQWTVFEPNNVELWAKIRRNINAYLTNVWRSGALFGATPQEAFFVKCDAENNPPEVRDLGQVVIEIGVAPVKPAEFVIFRISQWTGSGG